MIVKKSFCLAFLLACASAASVHAEIPAGWVVAGTAPSDFEMGSELGNRVPGERSGVIRAKKDSRGFGTLMQTVDAESYRGHRVRLSGFLRTKQAGRGQMWMRVDGTGQRSIGFDNMDDRPLVGDVDWKRCDIVLDVPENAADIAFGFMLQGKGEIWASDFHFETVGNDVPITGMGAPGAASADTGSVSECAPTRSMPRRGEQRAGLAHWPRDNGPSDR